MSNGDVESVIISEVERHYAATDKPYHLSQLGAFLSDRGIAIPDGAQLKDFVRTKFAGRLEIVQDKQVPARIAVTTLEKRDRVAEQIATHYLAPSAEGMIDYRQLPFSLIAAFCKIPDEGKKLFFRTVWPFRYETKAEAPGDAYIEIEEHFEPESLRGKDARKLSEDERRIIFSHIVRWAKEKSVDLRSLYVSGRAVSTPMGAATANPHATNALQRLIDAQDQGLESKIRIPLDIAAILMRLP